MPSLNELCVKLINNLSHGVIAFMVYISFVCIMARVWTNIILCDFYEKQIICQIRTYQGRMLPQRFTEKHPGVHSNMTHSAAIKLMERTAWLKEVLYPFCLCFIVLPTLPFTYHLLFHLLPPFPFILHTQLLVLCILCLSSILRCSVPAAQPYVNLLEEGGERI